MHTEENRVLSDFRITNEVLKRRKLLRWRCERQLVTRSPFLNIDFGAAYSIRYLAEKSKIRFEPDEAMPQKAT
jgi:hypothetical protein